MSIVGIALVSPLTARSALPDTAEVVERLLADLPAVEGVGVDRGRLAARGGDSLLAVAVEATPTTEAIATRPSHLSRTVTMQAALVAHPAAIPAASAPAPPAAADAPAPAASTVTGRASWYCHVVGTCPAGYSPSDAFVALPGALGGAGGRGVVGYVTVCADRCVELPVVDFCGCYWGTASQRVADLSAAAWALVTDTPRSTGILTVTLHLGS